MTGKRKEDLLTAVLRRLTKQFQGENAYHFLHDRMGITNEKMMACGLDELREYFQYEWAEGTLQMECANLLDGLLPQHNVYTTAAWITFAEELADGTEAAFKHEVSLLIAAFQEISERFSPHAVNMVYQTIHVPGNALLSNEIVMAAEAAEQGAGIQELSDMAANGLFEGGAMPSLKM